jgi:hypothetical protein
MTITESTLDTSKFKDAYLEFVDSVEKIRKSFNSESTDNYPTPQWISGKFKQLYNIPAIESSVNSGNINNTDKLEEYEKVLALRDVGVKYGLISKTTERNVGSTPVYKVTNTGSMFLQALHKSFASWKDLSTKFRETNDQENREWLKALPPEEKELVKIYSELTPREYAYLMGLVEKQESKEGYMSYIHSSLEKDRDKIEKLQSFNLLNKDYTLNTGLIKRLLNFLNEKTYPRLKQFNKDISFITDRISADKALLRNALERNVDRTSGRRGELAIKADKIIDKLSPVDKEVIKKAYRNNKLTGIELSHLKTLNILDADNSFTDIGKFIAVVLTKSLDNDTYMQQGEKPTQYSRLNKTDINNANNKNARKNERAGSRSGTFSNFLKTRHNAQ